MFTEFQCYPSFCFFVTYFFMSVSTKGNFSCSLLFLPCPLWRAQIPMLRKFSYFLMACWVEPFFSNHFPFRACTCNRYNLHLFMLKMQILYLADNDNIPLLSKLFRDSSLDSLLILSSISFPLACTGYRILETASLRKKNKRSNEESSSLISHQILFWAPCMFCQCACSLENGFLIYPFRYISLVSAMLQSGMMGNQQHTRNHQQSVAVLRK